jgi:hypothetical protein
MSYLNKNNTFVNNKELDSKKTTMISDTRDSKLTSKVTKSLIEKESNYLKNPEDYHTIEVEYN